MGYQDLRFIIGNVCLGYQDTIPVTLEDIIYHSRAVSRGVSHSFIVSDMPFMSYQVTLEQLKDPNKVFSDLMGDDVEPRREFILKNAKYATNVDI